MFRDDSAASSVLAVVLMMGFVAAASVSLFVIGTATITSSQNAAEDAQIENTFKEFNKDVSSVAYGRDKYRSMTFEVQDNKAAFRQENTGTIQVYVDGTKQVDKSVGALVYERDDSTIAYQAGGVWSGKGKDSRMVAEPPVEYQNGSLTFPIPALEGDENVRAGGLDIKKKQTVSPINDDGYIKGKLVRLEITSEYYMGWAEYFRTQTNDVAVSVDHSPAGPKGTVTVKLGKPVANGNFEDGVLATGGDDGDILVGNGNSEIDGNVSATGDITADDDEITGTESPNQESNLYELDEAIDRKIKDAKDNGSVIDVDLSGGDTLNGGNTYYAEDGFSYDQESEDLVVDLSGGNVTLMIDGDMRLEKGDIEVINHGSNRVFRVYTTGSLGVKNAELGPDPSDSAKHFQVYGTSEMLVALNGGSGTQFVGTIYAPRDDPALDDTDPNYVSYLSNDKCEGWDTCITTGSANVKGSIVAGPTKLSQGTEMTYDTSLQNVEPTLQLADGVLPPKITFIKVSVHKVEVNNSDQRSIEPVGGFGAPASVVSPTGSVGADAVAAAGPSFQVGAATRAPSVGA